MIYITKGESNNIVLTLTESTTITSSVYNFTFTSDYNEKEYNWEGFDTSPFPNRYNLFEFVEGVDLTLKSGQYTYSVKDANEVVVETGRMVVEGTDTNSIYE